MEFVLEEVCEYCRKLKLMHCYNPGVNVTKIVVVLADIEVDKIGT